MPEKLARELFSGIFNFSDFLIFRFIEYFPWTFYGSAKYTPFLIEGNFYPFFPAS